MHISMKQILTLSVLFLLVSCNSGIKEASQKVSLKNYAEEAMNKSFIGDDPIIVISQVSTKIYSKLDLNHPVFNNLNRNGLFIIPRNSDLIEDFWGEKGKINGAIVYMEAQQLKPEVKKLRYILNGKEIQRLAADTINMKNVKGYIVLMNKKTNQCVAFINRKE